MQASTQLLRRRTGQRSTIEPSGQDAVYGLDSVEEFWYDRINLGE